MKLEEIDLEKLLPLFMRGDKCNQAIARVASESLQVFSHEIAKLSTFDALEKLNTAELDELADELSVLWYDRDFTDEQKRALILNSDKVYMQLGTRAAVQKVVSDVFGAATVEEYWEADLNPHYFQIYAADAGTLSAENEAKLLRLIEYVKRKSQRLKKIYSNTIATLPLNVGLHVSFRRTVTPRIDTWQDNAVAAQFNTGAAIETKHTDTSNI